jgi:hypothetical protein
MSSFRPSPEQERQRALGRVLRDAGVAPGAIPDVDGEWRGARLGSRVAFFVLTILAAQAFGTFFALGILRPTSLWILGVLAIGVAEWLIFRKRFLGMGPEEALWVAGSLAIVFRILMMFKGGEPGKAMILIGLGFLVPGLRLLNPLFTTCAAVCFVWYADAVGGSTLVAAVFATAIAVLAALLFWGEIARPSYNAMLAWLVVAMPAAAFVCFSIPNRFEGLMWGGNPRGVWVTAVVFSVLAIAFAVLAIRRRLHAPLIAAILCLAALGFQCRSLVAAAVEWQLIIAGIVTLCIAIVLERSLRANEIGVTSRRLASARDLSLLEAAGAVVLAPATSAPADTPHGGGSFGGGGASGDV